MKSTFDADNTGAGDEEARFLAKVVQTLDGSLVHLPVEIEERLRSARQAALLQAPQLDSEDSAAASDFAWALESSEQQIPESVKLRLDGIRADAMRKASEALDNANAESKVSGWRWRRWAPRGFAVPASAFASICVLVTTLAIFNLSEPIETMPLAVAEDSLVLASEEEIELYENLEFYQWLADNGL